MGKCITGVNDLYTWCLANGDFGQRLLREWTGSIVKRNHIRMCDVARGSHKKVLWRCEKGHEWIAIISHRVYQRVGCPYCAFQKISEQNSKATDKNSLESWCLTIPDWGEQLSKEWTGKDENGNSVKMSDVTRASNKRVYWRCSKGHQWVAMISNRVSLRRGCPYCSNKGTSFPEQYIYHSLKQIYPKAENRCCVLKSHSNPRGIEFDIGIPEERLCIEYSPTYWHEGREKRDQLKRDVCKQYNVRYIEIIEDSYNELEHKLKRDCICFRMDYSKQIEILKMIVKHILKTLGHSINEIDLEKAERDARETIQLVKKQIA